MDLDKSDLLGLCKHGIGLSIMMFVLVIGWAVILMILMAIGSILGLLIGLGVLALGLGYINSYLADAVWDMDTDEDLPSKFFHGVLLFIVLLLVNLPWIAINHYAQHWLMAILLFIIYIPIHGYVGKRVAEVFETKECGQAGPTYWED
jgi:uncharacterized membrane protein YidH (DUF202 family)